MALAEFGLEVGAGDEAGGVVVFAQESCQAVSLLVFVDAGFGGGARVGARQERGEHALAGDGFGIGVRSG